MPRLINSTHLAEYLGVSHEYLHVWKADKSFPKPVRGKFWDIKAIEQYLDKLAGINQQSPNHDDIIFGRLKRGSDPSEISPHA